MEKYIQNFIAFSKCGCSITRMGSAADSTEFQVPEGSSIAIYRQLKQMILSREIPGGARLNQLDLAKKLNTSQTPIRGAIRMLEVDGLVVSDFGKGSRVRSITAKGIADVYELRGEIEGFVARKAATVLTDEQLVALQSLAEAADQADEQRTRVPVDRRHETDDIKFHLALARWSDNEQIVELYQRLVNMEILIFDTDEKSAAIEGAAAIKHVDISRAIASRQPDWAASVAKQHVRDAFNRMRQLIDKGVTAYRVARDGHRYRESDLPA
jgi:DNA-binding GntR family transcriptional regulator